MTEPPDDSFVVLRYEVYPNSCSGSWCLVLEACTRKEAARVAGIAARADRVMAVAVVPRSQYNGVVENMKYNQPPMLDS